MGIEMITIKDHEFLKDQKWIPNEGLNILTSRNGGGKTKLLEYIASKYHINYDIQNISTSVQNFRSLEDTEQYRKTKNMRPLEVRQFVRPYDVITHLPDNKELIQKCNVFFQELALDVRLDEDFVQSYRLLFRHTRIKTKRPLTLSQLSTGEKTAFILWLIMQENPKPDVLLLDEFDSSMDDDNISEFYKAILLLSKNVQVFIATHRTKELVTDDQERKWWRINNGVIDGKE